VAEDVLDGLGECPGGLRVHASLESAFISGDPVLAGRLVANLLDNARRYNVPDGEVWVSTGEVGGRCELTVANTGPVVDPDDTGRMFQPFERLSDRTSHDGFGLGLAIVASIAAIHGGTATARPRDDGGLAVTVTIPTASSAPLAASAGAPGG
jgi:signal transduction histidine kinase